MNAEETSRRVLRNVIEMEPQVVQPEPIGAPPLEMDFIVKIIDCKLSNGYARCHVATGDPPDCTIPASPREVKVYLAPNPFAKEEDFGFVRAFRSGPNVKYYWVRPLLDPLSPSVAPTEGELAPEANQDSPALATSHCNDNVVIP